MGSADQVGAWLKRNDPSAHVKYAEQVGDSRGHYNDGLESLTGAEGLKADSGDGVLQEAVAKLQSAVPWRNQAFRLGQAKICPGLEPCGRVLVSLRLRRSDALKAESEKDRQRQTGKDRQRQTDRLRQTD